MEERKPSIGQWWRAFAAHSLNRIIVNDWPKHQVTRGRAGSNFISSFLIGCRPARLFTHTNFFQDGQEYLISFWRFEVVFWLIFVLQSIFQSQYFVGKLDLASTTRGDLCPELAASKFGENLSFIEQKSDRQSGNSDRRRGALNIFANSGFSPKNQSFMTSTHENKNHNIIISLRPEFETILWSLGRRTCKKPLRHHGD